MLLTLVAALTLATVSAQNFQSLPPASAPVRRGKTIIIPLPKDASGEDVYPDCNKGKVCLPEAAQCAQRQQKAGATQYEGKTYWFSWQVEQQGCSNIIISQQSLTERRRSPQESKMELVHC